MPEKLRRLFDKCGIPHLILGSALYNLMTKWPGKKLTNQGKVDGMRRRGGSLNRFIDQVANFKNMSRRSISKSDYE